MIFLSWGNYSKLFNLTEYYLYMYIYIYIYIYWNVGSKYAFYINLLKIKPKQVHLNNWDVTYFSDKFY